MASATGQYQSYNPNNVLVGTATLWVAPNPNGLTPEPMISDTLALGTPWGGNWVNVGATETGVTWSVDEKDTDIVIEEQPNPVDVVAETQGYMFDVVLAEDTIENMLLAYGRGSLVATAGTGGRVDAACATTLGSAIVTDAATVATDVGKSVTGAGVPPGVTIISVNAGVSFVMSDEATATGSALSFTIGATGNKKTLTFSINKNKYSFGMEGVNTYGKSRRIYVPTGVVVGTKVDVDYLRAKKARTYKTTFQAISAPNTVQIVDFTS